MACTATARGPGRPTSTSATISGLSCGSSYMLAVDAYDAAANRSPQRTLTTTTSACPPPADTTPPTAPSNLSTSGVGQTAVTLSWTASSDNVGVVGYRTFRNGATVATVSGTASTFTGLTCGTSYTLAVEAYDAAGNISSRPSVALDCGVHAASRYAGAFRAAGHGLRRHHGDDRRPHLERVDRQRRRRWVPALPQRRGRRYRHLAGLHLSGLACGTSYTFALEAYDAAGNASNRAFATGTTSTSACSAPPPPPPPPPPSPLASGFWGCECVGGCGWWVVCQEGDACRVCERGRLQDVRSGVGRDRRW